MKTLKPEIGARIRITRGEEPYFKTGDLGTLRHRYCDNDWSADMDVKYKHGRWYVQDNFEVIEPAPTKSDEAKQGATVVLKNGIKGRLLHGTPDGCWVATFGYHGMPTRIGRENRDFIIEDPSNPCETKADFDLAISKSVRGE